MYSVSHDLRAPLTSMLGLIEISEEEVEDTFVTKNLQMIKLSIGKLDNFISDILDYSRNARHHVQVDEIDFKELLNDIMENLKYMNKDDRQVVMNVHIANDLIFATDKRRLSVIMNNLVSNAIRYQNIDSASPFVHISIEANNDMAAISVKDNGVGVKKEFQDKLFDMFYRVSRSSEGSGLGLYIVKETIEKLNGKIEIESEPGIGTSFNMAIPNLKQTLTEQNV